MRCKGPQRRAVRPTASAFALALLVAGAAGTAAAALPGPVGRMFVFAGVPLDAVGVVVQDVTKTPAAFHAAPRTTAQSRIGDEAGDDVRRARAARPRLPLADRCLPERPPRRWRSARRPDSQGPRRPQDHRRAMAGLHGGTPRERAGRDRRRPRSRPLALRLHRARPRRLRWRAAEALQRRTGRAARQFQDGQVRLRAERVRRRSRPQGRAAARERRCRSPASSRPPASAATGAPSWARRLSTAARARTPRSPVAIPRPAASASGGCPCSTTRRTSTACSTPTSARQGDVSPAAGRAGPHPPARSHSPRWSRRRCGTSSATSTSCRTT